jgi:hypothetical protein
MWKVDPCACFGCSLVNPLIDDDEFFYDLKYMVNSGRELKVSEQYLRLYATEDGPRRTQGRCRLYFMVS